MTSPLITGVAYQYKGQLAMRETHDRYPGIKLMQSETECYNGENQWQQGLMTSRKIIQDTGNFAGSYFYWNTVLNEVGRSHWGWHQNSLIIVDRTNKQVHYNPEFYSMKHFSAKVLPGARRIAVSGGPFADIVAFKNPSGDTIVEFLNDEAATIAAAIQIDDNIYQLRVPPQSMNTLAITSGR